MHCETCNNILETEMEKLWSKCEGCLGCRFPRKPTSSVGAFLIAWRETNGFGLFEDKR